MAFARRMTGYKRPDLLFTDLERLRAINRGQPFQMVMAGKAHPRDEGGKALIAKIHAHMRSRAGDIPMVFLPKYALVPAKKPAAAAAVWMNTPLSPHEDAGTSGLSEALQGVWTRTGLNKEHDSE